MGSDGIYIFSQISFIKMVKTFPTSLVSTIKIKYRSKLKQGYNKDKW